MTAQCNLFGGEIAGLPPIFRGFLKIKILDSGLEKVVNEIRCEKMMTDLRLTQIFIIKHPSLNINKIKNTVRLTLILN